MRVRILLAAVLASTATCGQAEDGIDLSTRSKSLAAASAVPAKQADAPFRAGRDPLPEMLLRDEQERRGPRGSCELAATSLCYDLADGRVVYRPARQYMPRFEGLTAESVSLRRDRLVLKYSFK
jgi:hypothetical protein